MPCGAGYINPIRQSVNSVIIVPDDALLLLRQFPKRHRVSAGLELFVLLASQPALLVEDFVVIPPDRHVVGEIVGSHLLARSAQHVGEYVYLLSEALRPFVGIRVVAGHMGSKTLDQRFRSVY
jgi:hypothetical protein